MSSTDVWTRLKQQGLVSGDKPASEHDSPWYVKTLLGFCGWLAAIFVFGFLAAGITDLLDSPLGCFILGLVLLVGAYTFLISSKSVFSEHLALAVSLAGQALIAVAVFEFTGGDDFLAWLNLSLLQMALALIMPNFVHRVFSSFASAMALAAALAEISSGYLASSLVLLPVVWLWLHEFRFPRHHHKLVAVAYGFTLALVFIQSNNSMLSGHGMWRPSSELAVFWLQPWLAELINAPAMLFVSWQLLQRHQAQPRTRLLAIIGALIFCAASFQAQGLSVGLMLILLGFSVSNRVLLGLGVASLLFYLSAYYYLLQLTLMQKAATLLLIGVLMLTAYALLRRFYHGQEADHA